jgi:hypothetical protein
MSGYSTVSMCPESLYSSDSSLDGVSTWDVVLVLRLSVTSLSESSLENPIYNDIFNLKLKITFSSDSMLDLLV